MGFDRQKNPELSTRWYAKPKSFLLGAFIIIVLVFNFNNCGPRVNTSSSELFNKTNAEITQELTKIHYETLPKNFCQQSENYECLLKNFTSTNKLIIAPNSPECVSLAKGLNVCPTIRGDNYDSSAAKQICQNDCEEKFDFAEYNCHIKLSVNTDGQFPLSERSPDLAEAIHLLHEACLSIQAGVNK